MLLHSLFRLAALISLATSSALPSEVAYINSVPIISRQLRRDAAPHNPKGLVARQAGEVTETIYCGCGINLESFGCNTATYALVSYLNVNPNVAAQQALGGTIDGVIAFICNTGNLAASITGTLFLSLLQQQVSQTCGSFVAGTFSDFVAYPPEFTSFSDLVFGYMNDPGGPDAACEAAKGSTIQYVIPNIGNGAGSYIC
jgi:hypothetical protein